MKELKIGQVIAGGMLLVALLKLPYGYYTLLRLVVCIIAALTAYTFWHSKQKWLVWPFGIVAILFNPIIKVYFDKSVWSVIDIVVAIMFLLAVFFCQSSNRKDA